MTDFERATPKGLHARAELLRERGEPNNGGSTARHLDLAADELTRLQERLAESQSEIDALCSNIEALDETWQKKMNAALAAEKASGERLRNLLREARQYVDDAGYDEDPEAQRNSGILLADIDTEGEKRLHAVGAMRRRVDDCWEAMGHTSKIEDVFVKGDGFVRVEWADAQERGSFHIPLERVFAPAQQSARDGVLEEVKRELFSLCEDTEERYASIAERDTEGKQGAFARGRMTEAKSIRNAMGEVFRASAYPPENAVLELVSRQAEDEGLWFKAETITEDYLQRALRELHATIERDARALSALRSGATAQQSARDAVPTYKLRGGPGRDFPCDDPKVSECAMSECQIKRRCALRSGAKEE